MFLMMCFLLKHPKVDPNRIVAMGVCQSGSYPLLANSARSEISANVVVYGGAQKAEFEAKPPRRVEPYRDIVARITAPVIGIWGEDDFVVSPDTLRFFNAMRMNGQANDLAVCAKWVGTDADQKPETWHRVNEFTGNIWGTWKDKWNKYLRDTWDFDYSSGISHSSAFEETPSGWDWNIHLRVMPANNLQCIVPTQSRSRHIGVVGIHSTVDCFDDTVAWNAREDGFDGGYFNKCV